MDGVGLGEDDPQINPLAKAKMPHLEALLDDHKLVTGTEPLESLRYFGPDAFASVPVVGAAGSQWLAD